MRWAKLSTTNAQIDSLFELAFKNGAIGGKACGAGGGGCLVFYSVPDKEHRVRKSLEDTGVDVMNFNFELSGLKTWKAN